MKKLTEQMRRIRKNEKASVTLEATIVMMVVIYVVVIMIYTTFILYQQVRIQAIANTAVERGAAIYSNSARDMYTGVIDPSEYRNLNPYWRIIEGRGTKAEKERKIEDYVLSDINGKNILKSRDNVKAEAKIVDYIIYKKITLDVTAQYVVPVGGFMEWVGVPNPYPINVHVESVVQDSAEMVRNADLAIDMVKKADNDLLNGKGQKLMSDIKSGLGKILDFFK